MSALTLPGGMKDPTNGIPPLREGDRLSQPEFHRRYLQYPEDVTFELVGGVVYMASPLSRFHSGSDEEIGYLLSTYRRATPGTEAMRNATTILGEKSETQPDNVLRVLPEYGGRSRDEGKYVGGPVELIAEIAVSSRAIDLSAKRDDYKAAGVLEYLVVCVESRELFWFHFPDDTTLSPDRKGVVKSRAFPGLWVHAQALIDLDSAKLRGVIDLGLASRPHAAFVRKLERRRKASS